MKIRNFYPRQVLRKLQGAHKQLDASQLAAIKYASRKGRKLGLSLMVDSTVTAVDVLAATSRESAQAVFANATTRIVLKEAEALPRSLLRLSSKLLWLVHKLKSLARNAFKRVPSAMLESNDKHRKQISKEEINNRLRIPTIFTPYIFRAGRMSHTCGCSIPRR